MVDSLSGDTGVLSKEQCFYHAESKIQAMFIRIPAFKMSEESNAFGLHRKHLFSFIYLLLFFYRMYYGMPSKAQFTPS